MSTCILRDEIRRLTGPVGLSPGEISILSAFSFQKSAAALLPPSLAAEILELDEFSLRDFPPKRISFAEIRQLKGLENEAVILVDLAVPPGTAGPLPDHYVGMSRARSLLVLIFDDPAATGGASPKGKPPFGDRRLPDSGSPGRLPRPR